MYYFNEERYNYIKGVYTNSKQLHFFFQIKMEYYFIFIIIKIQEKILLWTIVLLAIGLIVSEKLFT